MFEHVYGSRHNFDAAHARIVHHIAIGIDQREIEPSVVDLAVDAIKGDITRLAGGCTVLMGEGTWTPGSEMYDYSGPVENDIAVNFILTLTPNEHEAIWPRIREIIADTVRRFALGCSHIHAMIWQASSRVFEIEAPARYPALSRTVAAQ